MALEYKMRAFNTAIPSIEFTTCCFSAQHCTAARKHSVRAKMNK